MKKLVIIGASDFQNPLILKAKSKGYETHVFAWKCGDIGEKTADYFYPISIIEKENILEKCKEINPVGVVSIGSDLASITVSFVAENLGLVCNSIKSSEMSTNKHLMRTVFEEHELPSPKSRIVSANTDFTKFDLSYPLIVKPSDRSGSRGISKVESECQLKSAIERALNESFEKSALLEDFVEGEEFSLEYVSYKGEHHFLAMTKKYTTEAPNFVETGHAEPGDVAPEVFDKIMDVIPHALDALDIRYGASHPEVKIDDDGNFKIIEIGGRMGGDCIGTDLVLLSTGYDYVDMVIDIACGYAPNFVRTKDLGFAAVRFIFTENDLKMFEWVKKNHADSIFRISEIQPMDNRDINDSSSRYGYYIIVKNNRAELNEILEKING